MPTMRLDAILLDAGGTLVRLDYAAIARRAREIGFHLTEHDLPRAEAAARCAIDRRAHRLGGVAGTDADRVPTYLEDLLSAAGAPPALCTQLARRLEEDHRAHNLWRVPLEGAVQTLAELRRRGLRTAVVSNSDGRVERLLAGLGMTDHLDAVIDSHREGVEKPHPAIFERALARLGVAAARAAYVGDIPSIDVVGARRAGLRPVLLDPTGSYRQADCERIAALPELLDLLEAEG